VQAPHTRADPQRGSREAPERSGAGAHPRRRPADLEAGLAPCRARPAPGGAGDRSAQI